MARTNSVNFTGANQYPMASAGTDIFKKEDVQTLAKSVDLHDHSTGLGLPANMGAIAAGSIDGSKLVDNTVTSAKILDGTIQSVDIAAAGIANDRLGPDVARANQLTNPGFEVWSRGNGPFTGTNFSADRWAGSPQGTDTLSVSKDTTNVDTSSGSLAAAACTFTLGTGAGATQLYQTLKPSEGNQLSNRTISLSVRVRTSTANAVRLGVFNGSATTYSAYHTGDGTWQTLTITVTVVNAAAAVNLGVYFAASCTAYIDNAMLVVGSQPANYVPLHPADDLARCQRYYKRFAATSTLAIGAGQAYSAGGFVTTLLMAPQLAVTPTLTVSAAADWQTSAANLAYIACTSLTGNVLHAQSCQLIGGVASGLVAGNATNLQNTSGNSYIAFEANP